MTFAFSGDISLCFGLNVDDRALLDDGNRRISLYETVAQKIDVICCWKRQQSDVNDTDPSGNIDWYINSSQEPLALANK